MRKALHLCVGARVFLHLNQIWGVTTVQLGLMNGARGIVVAILYCAPNSQRADGLHLAGTGYPSGRRSQSLTDHVPRGAEACPLIDYVVVHFPSYSGLALFDGLPRTWIPVPCAEVRGEFSKRLTRVGLFVCV